MTDITKDDVRAFLREFKSLIKSHGFFVINRDDNLLGLFALGINEKARKKSLLSLNVLNYSSGPKTDEDQQGCVWIFGTTISEKEVYIKLKIVQRKHGNKAKCISFHPAERPLTYPFCPEKNNPEL